MKKFMFLDEHCQNCNNAEECNLAVKSGRATKCGYLRGFMNDDLGTIYHYQELLNEPEEDWETCSEDVERHVGWVTKIERAKKDLLQNLITYATAYGAHLKITGEIKDAMDEGMPITKIAESIMRKYK